MPKINSRKNNIKIQPEIGRAFKKLLREYFPNAFAIGITGSCASNSNHKFSDIDVLIVSELYANVFFETFVISGFLFEVYIYPKSMFENLILKDIITGECALLDRLSKIHIYQDKNRYLELKKKSAFELYRRGPIKFQNAERHKFSVLSTLNSLKGNYSWEECIFSLAQGMKSIIHLHAISRKIWIKSGKHFSKHLEYNDADFYKEFMHSLVEFYSIKKRDRIIFILNSLLVESGGFNKNLSSLVSNEFNARYLIIGLIGVTDMHNFIFQVLPMVLKEIPELDGNFFFYKCEKAKFGGVNFFIEIYYNRNLTKSTLIRKLTPLKTKLENEIFKVRMIYPINVTETNLTPLTNLFSGNTYFNYLCARFVETIVQMGGYKYSITVKLGYEFTLAVILENELLKTKLQVFNSLLFEEELANLFLDKQSNFMQLMDLRKRTIYDFERKYSKIANNKEILDLKMRLKEGLINNFALGLVKDFNEIFNKSEIFDNIYFKSYLALQKDNGLSHQDIYTFQAYKIVLQRYFGLIGLSQKDRCFCVFIFNNLTMKLQ